MEYSYLSKMLLCPEENINKHNERFSNTIKTLIKLVLLS